MAGIDEFEERLADVENAERDDYDPDRSPFTGARVWVLQESFRPTAEYLWVGVATSLPAAYRLADDRAERFQHGALGEWEEYGRGMRGPSGYRRRIAETNPYATWQMITQAFLNQ